MYTVQQATNAIREALKIDPRRACVRCLDPNVMSDELCDVIERHFETAEIGNYIVEDGLCSRCNRQAEVIHSRSAT
jgi:hypothetical protein